ncbi:hypothetical protein B7486_10125 [cyanobacterium TDX16]|nr:hypothetical protein B7486_10125 [cyanobacterium TDX16]
MALVTAQKREVTAEQKVSSRYTCALFSSLTAATLIAGCATGRVDLFDSGVLRLEKTPDKRGHYRDVHAYRTDEGILVIGYVRSSNRPAHVHILVEDSEGQAIVCTTTSVRRVPRSSRVRHARFEAVIPLTSTDGFVISVRHHIGRCEESERDDSIKPTRSDEL